MRRNHQFIETYAINDDPVKLCGIYYLLRFGAPRVGGFFYDSRRYVLYCRLIHTVLLSPLADFTLVIFFMKKWEILCTNYCGVFLCTDSPLLFIHCLKAYIFRHNLKRNKNSVWGSTHYCNDIIQRGNFYFFLFCGWNNIYLLNCKTDKYKVTCHHL